MVVPRRGEIVWLSFDPRVGHEQSGHRPALVLSNRRYNTATGLMFACPITSRAARHAFEISLPDDLKTKGVILVNQARALDWRERQARTIEIVPSGLMEDVLDVLLAFLEEDHEDSTAA